MRGSDYAELKAFVTIVAQARFRGSRDRSKKPQWIVG